MVHKNKEEKIDSTIRIIKAIKEINLENLAIQQILEKELSSEIPFEVENEGRQIKKEIISVLKGMKPKDSDILHSLVEALRVLDEKWADAIRGEIYDILFEAVPSVKLKEKTKDRLARRIKREAVSYKKKIIEILSETNSQSTVTLQSLAEGLNDPDVQLETVKALAKVFQQRWYSFLVVYLRGFVPAGFTEPGQSWWVKLYIARILTDYISQSPHPNKEDQKEAIKTLNQINVWYPLVNEGLIDIFSFKELLQGLWDKLNDMKIKPVRNIELL